MAEFRGIEVFSRAPRKPSQPSKPRQAKRQQEQPLPPRRRARLGIAAVIAGGVTVASTIGGIASAMFGGYEAGILLAYLATGTSVVAVLCGATSVVTSRGRVWGAIAILLGILASPPVLTKLINWASGLG